MAKYTRIFENGIKTNILNFMGRDYIEVWPESIDGVSTCKNPIQNQISNEYGDDDILGAIENLLMDYDESIEEALETLSGCENDSE